MTAPRVVADTVVLYQAFLNPGGPAGDVLTEAHAGRLTLVVSPALLAEVRATCLKPKLVNRFGYGSGEVDVFLEEIEDLAAWVPDVPAVFEYPRDPNDAYLIDLAVAADARLITSRDNDLLDLMDAATPAGRDFRGRFPQIEILPPPDLLARLRSGTLPG